MGVSRWQDASVATLKVTGLVAFKQTLDRCAGLALTENVTVNHFCDCAELYITDCNTSLLCLYAAGFVGGRHIASRINTYHKQYG